MVKVCDFIFIIITLVFLSLNFGMFVYISGSNLLRFILNLFKRVHNKAINHKKGGNHFIIKHKKFTNDITMTRINSIA